MPVGLSVLDIDTDIINPLNGTSVTVNGANIGAGNQSYYIGNLDRPAGANRSIIIGGNAATNASGTENIAIGHLTGENLTTGPTNTLVGSSAGRFMTTAIANTFIGQTAGESVSTGTGNTFIGGQAGKNTDPYQWLNTFIGFGTAGNIVGGGSFAGQNTTCIGAAASPSSTTVSNEFTLGSNINVLRCAATTITSTSDARDKKEIEELPVGLDFVNALKPVKFVWNDRHSEEKRNINDIGFIAQDLKETQDESGIADSLKLVYESNPEKLEASYGRLIPILVKAIQELSAEVKELKK
jgi:hypothetical protein